MFNLERFSVAAADAPPTQQSWPLRIIATYSADSAAAYIFVYQTAAAPVADQDFFSCVAGAPQMTELPIASGSNGVPYFRTDTMLAYCRSPDHAEELWEKVKLAVSELVLNLALADSLSSTEPVTILPDAPDA